jgi:hypothetical protein
MKLEYPKCDLEFLPESFILPEEHPQFLEAFGKK